MIQYPSYICDFGCRIFRRELRGEVGGFVDEREVLDLGVLGLCGADFEVVGFEGRVEGLQGRGKEGLGYVAG